MSWPGVRRVCMRLSFCLNIFFSETTFQKLSDFDEILKKYFCHGPLQNLIPSKTLLAMATKLKFF